jgi:ATP-binding cassette subfamily B protein
MSEPTADFGGVWRDRVRAVRKLAPVLHILWKSAPWIVTSALLVRFILACIPIPIAKVAAWIISGVARDLQAQGLPQHFWAMVALQIVLAIVAGTLNRLLEYLAGLLSDRYTHHLSILVMKQAAQLDLATHEDPIFYDSLERARIQARDRMGVIQTVSRLLQQMMTTAAFVASLLYYSAWLPVILIAGALPSFFSETHLAFLGYSKNFRQTPIKRRMDYLCHVAGDREGAKESKLLGLGKFFIQRFRVLSEQIYREDIEFSRKRLGVGALVSLLGTLGFYTAYLYVIYRAVSGLYDLKTFIFLTTVIIQANSNMQQMFSTASGVADQALFLADLGAFFEMKPLLCSKVGALITPRPVQSGFKFDNVSFTYPGNNRPILHNFNFSLRPGERIGLIGANGQGKTTIVKLMVRMYDPTEGQILLDGIDLREYSIEDLHRQTAIIFQDFMRYEMTVRENIAIGNVDENGSVDTLDMDSIEMAAQKSLADSVVKRLPLGYEQLLGRRFEKGLDLSGGEWQRVALARVYIRDSQLVVLDEPTASLDPHSEFEVFQRFAQLTAGKMVLLISHRFSTVRMADQIAVLESGRIVELGAHDELIRRGGSYKRLFEMQAASYR